MNFCIEFGMRVRRLGALAVALLLWAAGALNAATPGSFRGTVVGDQGSGEPGWIYVQGRDRAVRRVDISRSSVEYGDDVLPQQRQQKAVLQLLPGTEVRVTAIQGSDGEWRATHIEILKMAGAQSPREKAGKS